MLNTTALRRAWAPACSKYGREFLAAYAALDACFKAFGYKVRKKDTGAYNCRRITGGSGHSLHSYGPGAYFTFWTGVRIATALAVDVNWQSNPWGPRLITDMPRKMIDAILAIRTNSGAQVWGWGGDYRSNRDAMHFEIVCSPADLASGIDSSTLPGRRPVAPPPAKPAPPKDQEFTVNADDEAKIRKIVAEETNRVLAPVLTLAAAEKKRDGSLYGWVRAIATKVGASRDEALKHDPTN